MVNCQLSETGTLSHYPHGRVQPFHQKSTGLMHSTLGPYVVQIWSRNSPESGPNETLVLHQVEASDKSIVGQGTRCEEEAGTLSHCVQGYLAHNKTPPPPQDCRRTIGIGLQKVPRGRLFLMSEVPLQHNPIGLYRENDQYRTGTRSQTGPLSYERTVARKHQCVFRCSRVQGHARFVGCEEGFQAATAQKRVPAPEPHRPRLREAPVALALHRGPLPGETPSFQRPTP